MNAALTDALANADLLAITGGEPDQIQELPGGLTNRNYQLNCPGGLFVLRLNHPDPQSLDLHREYELAVHQAAAAQGISPAVRYMSPDQSYWLRDFITGGSLTPEQLTSHDLSDISQILEKAHQLTIPSPAALDFRQKCEHYLSQLRNDERDRWLPEIIAADRLPAADRLVHMDPVPANWLRADDGRLWLIDWEYCASAHPLLDYASVYLHLPPSLKNLWLAQVPTHQSADWSTAQAQIRLLESLWYRATDISAL